MAMSMVQSLVPPMIGTLNNLAGILKKGEAHATAKGFDPAVLVSARLFPDMFTLSRQVQIAADVAKAGAARLAGIDPPSYADNEATFAELQERISKTIAFIESIPAEKFSGAEDRTVTFKIQGNEMSMQGLPFLNGWVLPNVYFHVTTAYNILRHNGVELGKRDFLGRV